MSGLFGASVTFVVWFALAPKAVDASRGTGTGTGASVEIKIVPSKSHLRVHRQLSTETLEAGQIYAICDEGNGTMVYLVYRSDFRAAPAMTAVPHGCHGAETREIPIQ